MSDWQPIETAPKDGTRILVWIEPGYITVGFWLTHSHVRRPRPYWGSELMRYPSRERRFQPTYWQPIPAPPAYLDARKEAGL